MDLQRFLGEIAADVVEVLVHVLGDVPGDLRQGGGRRDVGFAGSDGRGGFDGEPGGQPLDSRVVADRAGDQAFFLLAGECGAVLEPPFEGVPVPAGEVVSDHPIQHGSRRRWPGRGWRWI